MLMDYYNLPVFDDTGLVTTVFTAKSAGGCWLSNNPEGWANYRKVLKDFHLTDDDITSTFQRHSANVMAVTRKEAGRHVFYRPDPMIVVDGLVTDEPGYMLCSMESDCTPVFLLDPVRRAIGMVHSGWKGTASLISVNAVRAMEENYGCRAEDIMVGFGPCICRDCYEVGADLIPHFAVNYSEEEIRSFFIPKSGGKYLLDVNEAISVSLVREGVRRENIHACPFCTFHDDLFFSHRRELKDGLEGKDNMFTGIMLNRA